MTGGNSNLKPEKAQTWSTGMDYTPSWLQGFRASTTFWSIQYNNQINSPGLSQSLFSTPALTAVFVEQYILSDASGTPIPAAAAALRARLNQISASVIINPVQTLPLGQLTVGTEEILHAQSANIATSHINGLDLEVNYSWSTNYGAFAARVAGTKTLDWDLSPTLGSPLATTNDANPFLKFRGDLNWSLAPLTARASVNYLGTHLVQYATTAGPTAWYRIDPFITVDLAASYDMGNLWSTFEGTTFSININNALNVSPPIDPGQLDHGWSPLSDPRGRMVWFGVKTDW